MSDHVADVRRYDAIADEEIIDRIIRHLGVALRNRDSSLVSCSDPKELERVRTSWCERKLGVPDAARADLAIGKVCETMAGDRAKSRVTFYYLVAKHLGRLETLKG